MSRITNSGSSEDLKKERFRTEREFGLWLESVCRLYNWRYYHTFRSKHSVAGFPDYVLVRDGYLIFAELKLGKNEATQAQDEWLGDLTGVALRWGPGVSVYLWRPEDEDSILMILK